MQQSPSNFTDNEGRNSTINVGKIRLSQYKCCNSNPCQKAGENPLRSWFSWQNTAGLSPWNTSVQTPSNSKTSLQKHSLYVSAHTRWEQSLWRKMGSTKSKRGKVNLTRYYQDKEVFAFLHPEGKKKKKAIQTHSFTLVLEPACLDSAKG